MSDPRVLRALKVIDGKLDLYRSELQQGLAGVDEELEMHAQQLASHDDQLTDHERRLKRLEGKRDDEKSR